MTDPNFEVTVIGGGVAGLCASIAAHDTGARTLLVEASDQVGGTASWSGGALWIPVNHHLLASGGHDSREMALAYMRDCCEGQADESLLLTYLDQADSIIRYLEEATPLECEVGTMPDYQGNRPGGFYEPGRSRSLAPKLFNINRLGDQAGLLRRSPYGTMPFGYQEFAEMDAALHPERIDAGLYAERLEAGIVGWGEALAAALLLGVLERGIEVRVSTRATGIAYSTGGLGLTLAGGGGEGRVIESRAVILCTGGYEWDAGLVDRNFPGLEWTPSTVPSNRGDGWHMAESLGADMGNLGACWGWPSYRVPGEQLPEGVPLMRTTLVERNLPHLVVVNPAGRRFVDESLPYHSIFKALLEQSDDGRFRNQPAFHVFDAQFREKYAFGPVAPGAPLPDWVYRADSLEGLADAIGVDAAGLAATIEQFNNDVRTQGRDTQFHRGEEPYGQFWGDPENAAGPNLGTLEKPPFHAVPMEPSTIGTCGGPTVDTNGRVLDPRGNPIAGLYAAGNAAAAISGPAYLGPGGTIGPAMVYGVLAGRHAGEQKA